MRVLPLLASLALAGCAHMQYEPAPFVVQEGQIDLAVGPDGNTVILDAPAGLVVVDSGRHPGHAGAIVEHAMRVGKPVAALVNTHWHLDHTTGNRDVLAAHPDARLVATGAMARALEGFLARSRQEAERRLADPALSPDERPRIERSLAAMNDREAMVPAAPVARGGTVTLGGRDFELRVAPAAATEADLWLLATDKDLVVVGDLVVAPVPFFDTGCEEGWTKALAEIDGARWQTLIPGHGAAMTRADFSRWRRAFETWLECAGSAFPAAECAAGWMRNAEGFYSAAEAASVRMLAEAYVSAILRKPEARMDYCA